MIAPQFLDQLKQRTSVFMMNAQSTPLAVIVLAAGKGTRMKSELAKVLTPMAGKPMVHHVLEAAGTDTRKVVIVGHQADAVKNSINTKFNGVEFAHQHEQLGTGHAVQQAESTLQGFEGDAIILSGDVPLVTPTLIKALLKGHGTNAVTVATTTVENPFGLGRIVRDAAGNFKKITEQKDASEDEQKITEINTGIYMVKLPLAFDLLKKVKNNNASGEYYLPDIIALALDAGFDVGTCHVDDGMALLGVNTPEQLALAESIYNERNKISKGA